MARDIAAQLSAGCDHIGAVMIESNLFPGNQKCDGQSPLQYGVSITDACVGWEETLAIFETLAEESFLSIPRCPLNWHKNPDAA